MYFTIAGEKNNIIHFHQIFNKLLNKQTSGIFLIFLLERDNLNCGDTIFI